MAPPAGKRHEGAYETRLGLGVPASKGRKAPSAEPTRIRRWKSHERSPKNALVSVPLGIKTMGTKMQLPCREAQVRRNSHPSKADSDDWRLSGTVAQRCSRRRSRWESGDRRDCTHVSRLLKVHLSEDCLRVVILSDQRNTRRLASVGSGSSWPLFSVVALLIMELAFIIVFPACDTLAALRLNTLHFALAAHITRCYNTEALLALTVPLRLLVNELHCVE